MTLGLNGGHVSYLLSGWFQDVFHGCSCFFSRFFKPCFMLAIFAEDSRFGSYLSIFVSLPGRSFPTWSSPDSHVLVPWERYPIGSMHGILWYIIQQLADFYDTFWQTYTMHGYAWILWAWSNK